MYYKPVIKVRLRIIFQIKTTNRDFVIGRKKSGDSIKYFVLNKNVFINDSLFNT